MARSEVIKKRITTSTIISLLIIGGIVYFAIMPQIENIQKTKGQIEKQRMDLEKRYIQGQNLKELTQNLEIVEEKITDLEKIYIKPEEALEFITTLENIAEITQITQKIDMSPFEETKTANKLYQEKPLQISLTGKFNNLLEYLSLLESLNYYINISTLEITGSALRTARTVEFEQEKEILNMKISANIYWATSQN